MYVGAARSGGLDVMRYIRKELDVLRQAIEHAQPHAGRFPVVGEAIEAAFARLAVEMEAMGKEAEAEAEARARAERRDAELRAGDAPSTALEAGGGVSASLAPAAAAPPSEDGSQSGVVGEGVIMAADGKVPIPNAYICPISFEIMSDPVVTSDGFTYERKHIMQWLESHSTSPSTGATLESTFLIPNVTVRGLILDFLEENPGLASKDRKPKGVGEATSLAAVAEQPSVDGGGDKASASETRMSIERGRGGRGRSGRGGRVPKSEFESAAHGRELLRD